MKKKLLFLSILYSLTYPVQAQINYSFSSATATYTPITTGTNPVLSTPYIDYGKADEGYANNIPLGFSFVYNGVAYSTVNVNVNGYLAFGAGFLDDPDETFYENNLTSGPELQQSVRPVVAPLWDDLHLIEETNLRYEVTGTAPNRVFTMEWARARWSFEATAASISFQAKLYETTNVIEFAYKREAGATSGASASIGLTSTLSGPGNFLSLGGSSANPATSTTVENASIATRPATNQVYRFTPLACAAPSVTAVTNLTPTSATFSWNAIAGVTGYEYAVSTTNVPPASGTATSATSVNLTNLSASANNYLFVRSNCGSAFSAWSRRATVLCTSNTLPVNGAITTKSPMIAWNPVAGATAYTIMFGVNANDFDNLGSIPASETSVSITNLAYNTTYYFYVRPVIVNDTAPQTCKSNATSFTVGDAPIIPCTQNLLPEDGAKNVSPAAAIISWKKITDATAYAILLSIDDGATYETIGFTEDTLVNLGGSGLIDYNTKYYYYIRPIVDADTASLACNSTATYFRTSLAPAPPVNDNCETATVLSLEAVNATTLGATEYQAAEECNGFSGNANDDVWFKFTALFNGTANILLTNAGRGLDAVLQGYRGSCGALIPLACADNTLDAGNETLVLPNLVAGQTYYFRVFGYGEAIDGGTFTVQINGTALPIVLKEFTGKKAANKNVLNWTTQTELNNKGFELQRSADGINFNALTWVPSKGLGGNSSVSLAYESIDVRPLGSSNFYRLKQVNKDGSFVYSSVVVLKGNRPVQLQLSVVFPNPVRSILKVVVASPTNEDVTLLITDMQGRSVHQQVGKMVVGDNQTQLDVSKLSAGSYFIKAVCNSGSILPATKFIKQ